MRYWAYSFIHSFIIDNTENHTLNRDVRLVPPGDVVEIPISPFPQSIFCVFFVFFVACGVSLLFFRLFISLLTIHILLVVTQFIAAIIFGPWDLFAFLNEKFLN